MTLASHHLFSPSPLSIALLTRPIVSYSQCFAYSVSRFLRAPLRTLFSQFAIDAPIGPLTLGVECIFCIFLGSPSPS